MYSGSTRTFQLVSILILFQCVYGFIEDQNVRENVDINFNTARDIENSERFPLTYSSSWYTQNTEKIVGGKYANEGQFPFMAVVHRLIRGGMISQCGGTVISRRWVLTAGHCIGKPPHKFHVIFGVINKSGIGYNFNRGRGVSMMTSTAVVHPEYFHSTNDIGLLYMPQDIPYTQNIHPIRLAGSKYAGQTFADLTAYVIGWGKDRQTGSGTKALKYAQLPIIYNRECRQYWEVDERNICTATGYGQNACQGDSGGPLVIIKRNRLLQVGIVSYGDKDCPSGKPGVFTRVSTYAKWIESVTGMRI